MTEARRETLSMAMAGTIKTGMEAVDPGVEPSQHAGNPWGREERVSAEGRGA